MQVKLAPPSCPMVQVLLTQPFVSHVPDQLAPRCRKPRPARRLVPERLPQAISPMCHRLGLRPNSIEEPMERPEPRPIRRAGVVIRESNSYSEHSEPQVPLRLPPIAQHLERASNSTRGARSPRLQYCVRTPPFSSPTRPEEW